MAYPWLDNYLLSQTAAKKDFKIEWNATRYMVGDKMFALIGGDKYGKPIVTVKCEPPFGAALREKYPAIVPGYYMNKLHWNSVALDGGVPDDVLKEMIDMSYRLIVNGLSKKAQRKILGYS